MASTSTRGSAAHSLNRRTFITGALASVGAASLTGCASLFGMEGGGSVAAYGALPNERFPIPAVDVSKVRPEFLRRAVSYTSNEAPGTIVVDLANYHLYRVEGNNRAIRYGINTPLEDFLWSGNAEIERKAEWPVWTPTRDQVGRDPTLVRYAGGMPPGLANPLGARALYLYQNGADTLCRIYGTDQAWTLGHRVSSGCVGLLNQDIIDLYERTALNTKVVLLPARTA